MLPSSTRSPREPERPRPEHCKSPAECAFCRSSPATIGDVIDSEDRENDKALRSQLDSALAELKVRDAIIGAQMERISQLEQQQQDGAARQPTSPRVASPSFRRRLAKGLRTSPVTSKAIQFLPKRVRNLGKRALS